MMPAGSKGSSRRRSAFIASRPIRTPHTHTGITNQWTVRSEPATKASTVSVQNASDSARLLASASGAGEATVLASVFMHARGAGVEMFQFFDRPPDVERARFHRRERLLGG